MPGLIEVEFQGPPELAMRMRSFPTWWPKLLGANFRTMGVKTTRIMQRVLLPVKYKGHLSNSVSSSIDVTGMRLTVGPTAKESAFVYYGTKPHWAPIGPLKEWARWKLGDEKAAWAIRASIRRRGTAVSMIGRPGMWLSQYGIGFDFLGEVVKRADFAVALSALNERLGARVGRILLKNESPVGE